jgi:DMSO/TMAO reductase YedYZ molybdopterin-dependent catalytic subunit
MKLRMPTKLGYKNPKHIQAIFVSNTFNRGYWKTRATTGSAAADDASSPISTAAYAVYST